MRRRAATFTCAMSCCEAARIGEDLGGCSTRPHHPVMRKCCSSSQPAEFRRLQWWSLPKTYVLTDGEIIAVCAKRLRCVDPADNPRAPRREHLLDWRRTSRCAEVILAQALGCIHMDVKSAISTSMSCRQVARLFCPCGASTSVRTCTPMLCCRAARPCSCCFCA